MRRAVDACVGLVLVVGPAVDSAPPVGTKLPALGPPAAAQQVRCDPVQPRQDGVGRAAARTLRECESERLGRQLVGELAAGAPVEVAVNGLEMPIEDRLERIRLAQRARQARLAAQSVGGKRVAIKPFEVALFDVLT